MDFEFDTTVPKRNKFFFALYLFFKRVFDIFASVIGTVLLSPLFLAIAIAIKADDGGRVFYKHERVGYKGKKIFIYKFRSMREDANENLESVLTPEQLEQYRTEYKIDNDPRITRVGSFLRRTSLDELPQFINIIMGSLSLIGPRPLVEKELEMYGDAKDKLLSAKPGLTGYWQVYARNTVGYENGERQKMELYYVDHRSLLFDTKLFFKTFVSVIKKTGAK
ncbi:MAG: sugar transferase [Clostridia bacterium]|nr:sugar transferase [Clostridia bacterium]